MPHNTGMDWIRLEKRLAIYSRDGFDCVWCRLVFPLSEHGYGLHLDHIHDGLDNTPTNLVTSCRPCNSSRKRLRLPEWLERLEKRHGTPQEEIALRVLLATGKPLDMGLGRALAKQRRPKAA